MKITSNISVVLNQVQVTVQKLKNPDQLLRTVASTLTAVISDRVHTQGKDSSGGQIGTYSEGYMKVRTGNFGNSARISRGKDKGKAKDSGLYSRGAKKGTPRPKYNRTADTKVVGSLTRQMENDMSTNQDDPIKTTAGYGIGFKNPHNFDKAIWLEETYKKPIWKLTTEEDELVKQIVEKYTSDAITGENS